MARVFVRRLKIGVWFLLGTLVALVWGEAFTRILLPQSRDTVLDILQADPIIGYTYEPGSVMDERGRDYDVPFVVNSVGLRDREIGPKEDGVFRVLLAGNSFTVSHGVEIERSLSRALENELNAAGAARRVEVVNTANAGYNAFNYWKSFSRWAPLVEPDAVVVGFVQAREHKCDADDTCFFIRDGLLVGRYKAGTEPNFPPRSPLFVIRKHLARTSDLYVLLRNYFYYNEQIDRLMGRGGSNRGALEELRPYVSPLPASIEKGWDLAYGHLQRLRDETSAAGVPLIVLSIPEKSEVDIGYFETLASQAGIEEGGTERSQPSDRLKDFCAAARIPLLDCGPAVAAAHAVEPAYFRFDNHWNARGVLAGARAVVAQWRTAGLPPFARDDATADVVAP